MVFSIAIQVFNNSVLELKAMKLYEINIQVVKKIKKPKILKNKSRVIIPLPEMKKIDKILKLTLTALPVPCTVFFYRKSQKFH